jgi:hypothetical protein
MYKITYIPMQHIKPDGSPQYDEAKLKHHGIEPHEKKKLEALGIEPDHDPVETSVGGITFKVGEPVEVNEEDTIVPYTLMNNPWFKVEEVKSKKHKKEKDSDDT